MAAGKKHPAKKTAARKSASKRAGGRKDTMSRDVVCRAFALSYLRYGNATRAFREAVPNSQANDNTAHKAAYELLHDERTQRHIDDLRLRLASRSEATLSEWVANDLRLARSDPARLVDEDGHALPLAEIDPDTRHAIQGIDLVEEKVETTKLGETEIVRRTRVRKIRLHAKDGAQDRLARYLGAYKTDNEQQNWATTLLAKLPAAQLATLEDLLRGCGTDASNGGEASAGSSPAAPARGQ